MDHLKKKLATQKAMFLADPDLFFSVSKKIALLFAN